MDLKAGVSSVAVSRDPNEITPDDSPLRFEEALASPVIQRLTTPTLVAGDAALDFAFAELDLTSGVARPTGRTFHLAGHAGLRPVALIFGSYT
jgi:hypothetical protein